MLILQICASMLLISTKSSKIRNQMCPCLLFSPICSPIPKHQITILQITWRVEVSKPEGFMFTFHHFTEINLALIYATEANSNNLLKETKISNKKVRRLKQPNIVQFSNKSI